MAIIDLVVAQMTRSYLQGDPTVGDISNQSKYSDHITHYYIHNTLPLAKQFNFPR